MRKLILSAALVAASVFGMAAVQAAEPVAGKEYIELSNPVPVSVPGKIEVVELFCEEMEFNMVGSHLDL